MDTGYRPIYLRLFREGILQERIDKINSRINPCILCPHECLVDRFMDNNGNCRSGVRPIIASYGPHFGEEPQLTGVYGSGTIFLSNCNLSCIFCQNYDISQLGSGRESSTEDLANMMVELQLRGCHNINFVTPTHMIHAIVNALPVAIENGLRVPLVYNSGGYDSVETLGLLEGIFDIYMPDLKYFDDDIAFALSGIRNYVEKATSAIREMYRQVGDLYVNDSGIALRGMIIRHLILPGNLGNTFRVIDFVGSLSVNTCFNLMDLYRPEYKACSYPALSHCITRDEMERVESYARKTGLKYLVR